MLDHAGWSLKKKLEFSWGEEELQACDDKWMFVFEAKPAVKIEDEDVYGS